MDEPTVFVVDDDKGVRRSLTALGRAHGLAVKAYASGEDFLAAYDPSRPGCLILDVRLAAGKNGLDLQDELGRRGHDLPIIVMTGYGNVSASVRSFRGGAVDFLEKPVVPRVLLSRIRDALAVDQRRQEHSAVRRRLARLTSREKEVAALLVKGKRSKEVAATLGISPRTAEGHRRQVLRKMEVSSTAELATAWLAQQSTTPDVSSRSRSST
jgi:two-component system, LuxR family, response regulator FixJ